MSTTDPSSTFTDGSSSTSTPSSTSSQSNSGTATLYLFTFLATILILVLLSASLVLRSYVLRRRYRQRLQQALADGLFIDLDRSAFNGAGQFDTLDGFRRSTRRLGAKPVLWDSRIHPTNKDDSWSSIEPIAVCYSPSPPPPPPLMSSPQPSTAPPGSPSSLQPQNYPSFFSQLRIPSPLSLSSRPSSALPPRTRTTTGSPTPASTRPAPPAVPTPPDPGTCTETEAVTLAVWVLVAMPDVTAPVHRSIPDAKGKGVDPLESQVRQQGGDADPNLPSSLHRSGARKTKFTTDEDGLPLLEFGVVELRTKELWTT